MGLSRDNDTSMSPSTHRLRRVRRLVSSRRSLRHQAKSKAGSAMLSGSALTEAARCSAGAVTASSTNRGCPRGATPIADAMSTRYTSRLAIRPAIICSKTPPPHWRATAMPAAWGRYTSGENVALLGNDALAMPGLFSSAAEICLAWLRLNADAFWKCAFAQRANSSAARSMLPP